MNKELKQLEDLLFQYRTKIDDKIMEGEEYQIELNAYRRLQKRYYEILEG